MNLPISQSAKPRSSPLPPSPNLALLSSPHLPISPSCRLPISFFPLLSLILASLAWLLLTGCAPATTIADAPSPTPGVTIPAALPPTLAPTSTPYPTPVPSPTPAPLRGGTLVLGLVGQPTLSDPLADDPALDALRPLLYDSLWQVDPQTAALRPGLAIAWEYSANGRRLTFHLPPGLRWSDGAPLTASDLVDSLQATAHPALNAFSRIEAPDNRTLTLTFAGVDCPAATTVGLLPLMRQEEDAASFPVGSGPFVVAEKAADGRSFALAANPHYRGPASLLDGISVRFLPPNALAIALSEGYFDLVGPLSGQQAAVGAGQLSDVAYPAAHMIYVAMNFDPKNEPPLPLDVRRALTLALDRQAILSDALAGDGQLLAGPFLPDHWAAVGNLSPPPYDSGAARDLLAQAGLRDTDGDGWLDRNGERVELGIRVNGENPLHQNLGWLVSSYYRDLGLFARAESVPAESLIDDLFTHDFQLAIFGWPLSPDPDQRQFWHSTENTAGAGLNFTSYRNRRVDDLLDRAAATPGCNSPARAKLYAAFQQILADERPVDFLLTPNRHLLVSDRVYGVAPGPFAAFTWNAVEWYLQPQN